MSMGSGRPPGDGDTPGGRGQPWGDRDNVLRVMGSGTPLGDRDSPGGLGVISLGPWGQGHSGGRGQTWGNWDTQGDGDTGVGGGTGTPWGNRDDVPRAVGTGTPQVERDNVPRGTGHPQAAGDTQRHNTPRGPWGQGHTGAVGTDGHGDRGPRGGWGVVPPPWTPSLTAYSSPSTPRRSLTTPR